MVTYTTSALKAKKKRNDNLHVKLQVGWMQQCSASESISHITVIVS